MGQVAQKQEIIAGFKARLGGARAVIVAENAGLTVAEFAALRASARACGARLNVVKNTLARRALADTDFSALSAHLRGPLIYGIGEDPAGLAKTLSEFAAKNGRLIVRAGALERAAAALDAPAVARLARLPGRDVLLAQLAATMAAPIGRAAQTLNEIPARFVRALAALRDARASDSAQATIQEQKQ